MVELLSPAGDFESLRAAVLNGADAVYIGGREFSARQYAGNFNRDEMIEAVRFCHSYNVKVYATVNTLLNNAELERALEYASFLYGIGVDAIIVQDIGFLKLLRENLPDFEVHASTQMTVHNLDAVNLLYGMGVKRIVLSRELSLDEIRYITQNTKAEIEIFVHGALCISFSGQCLFSSMIGGRSGNRGRCAQPCRMEYTIDSGKKAYHLCPKDLSTLEFIKEIEDTGVASLKIEGRMKRPEYVATVVSAYRRALDGKARKEDIEKVTQIFNRGGFTSAFLKGRQGADMMSFKRPKNWGTYLGRVVSVNGKFASILLEKSLSVGDGVEIFGRDIGVPVTGINVRGKSTGKAEAGEIAEIYLEGAKKGDAIYKSLDIELIKEAEESFKGKNIKKMSLSGSFKAHKGDKVIFKIQNINGVFGRAFSDEPEKAFKAPTTMDKIRESLLKTGDTPFYFESIDIDMDDDIALPVSKINALRRDAINNLIDRLQGKREEKRVNIMFKKIEKNVKTKIAVRAGRIDIAKACIDSGCDVLFFGGDKLRINSGCIEDAKSYAGDKVMVYPWYPEIMLEDYDRLKEEALNLKASGIDTALCGNMGFYAYLKNKGFKVCLDRGFNIFNSPACDTFENNGCFISPELNLKQMKDLISKTGKRTMVPVYGRIKLMVSRHCFVGSSMGHGKEGCPTLCKNTVHYIKDRRGEVFPIITDYYCKNHIYNSKILCTIEHMKDIINLNADYIVLDFVDEAPKDAALAVAAYKESLKSGYEGKYGLTENMKKLLDRLEGKITKGHFYRGVE